MENPTAGIEELKNKGRKLIFNDSKEDRKLFVHNLGLLLSQTREGIKSCELGDNEIVTVTYRSGYEMKVNVNMDSYMAIISDVTNHIKEG